MRAPVRHVAVGVVVVAVLATGGIVLAQRATRTPPQLPRVSTARLIGTTVTALARGRPQSGTVSATVDLGLPDLVDVAGQGGPLSLLTGTNTLKVWRSRGGLRISLLQRAGEQAVFVSHGRAWAWDFDSLTAYDLGRLPPVAADLLGALGGGGPGMEPSLERRLAALARTTRVEVAGTGTVAGRPVYRLVLTPKQPGTLVGAVEIDIDAVQRLPLALFVVPRASDRPAISAQFTSVRFDAIDPATYVFRPPPDVAVQRIGSGSGGGSPFSQVRDVRTFGRAWTTVVAVEVPPFGGGLGGFLSSSLLQVSGPLFSVRVADREDHAWVLLGAVPMARLRAVESLLA